MFSSSFEAAGIRYFIAKLDDVIIMKKVARIF